MSIDELNANADIRECIGNFRQNMLRILNNGLATEDAVSPVRAQDIVVMVNFKLAVEFCKVTA